MLFPKEVSPTPSTWSRPGRVRGLHERRLAERVRAAADAAEGLEHEQLTLLAATADYLADRSRGERGWTGR